MAKPKQVKISVISELENVSWEVAGFALDERFDEPFALTLELETSDTPDPPTLLGTTVTATIERDDHQREISGIVTQLEDGASSDGVMNVVLTVVPALVALSHRRTSRIFQAQTIPAILSAVLSEGLAPYGRSANLDALSSVQATQEYVVQYRETDLEFVTRLMQEHGISYMFRQAVGDKLETLYLFEDDGLYTALSTTTHADDELPIITTDGGSKQREEAQSFTRTTQLRPTVARTQVFDWTNPSTLYTNENSDAAAGLSVTNGAALSPEHEDYDHIEPATLEGYRSAGLDSTVVDAAVSRRRQLHQRDAILGLGQSTATGMAPGVSFELTGHAQADQNGEYVCYRAVHQAGSLVTDGEVDDDNVANNYTNSFYCLPKSVTWRPARTQARPRLPGIQTARVVGETGEEIYTDAYGRIKVQFSWDRDGASNEASSCFIRVAQPLAGDGWGTLFLPRVGMEVVVSFIEGDLDRPVVTSCLYNGSNSPPYTLPDDKTKSTLKTSSSPGGGGYNELRIEDAAGAEEIYIRAERDFNEAVGNDHGTTVSHDQTLSVGHDQSLTVTNDRSSSIGGNQSATITGNDSTTVNASQSISVTNDQSTLVVGDQFVTIESGQTLDVSNDRTIIVGGNESHSVTGTAKITVGGAAERIYSSGLSETVTGNYTQTTAGNTTISSAGTMTMSTPAGWNVAAPSSSVWTDYSAKATGFSFSFCATMGISITPLTLTMIGVKLDIIGVKLDLVQKLTIKTKPTEIVTGITQIKKMFTIIDLSDFEIFV